MMYRSSEPTSNHSTWEIEAMSGQVHLRVAQEKWTRTPEDEEVLQASRIGPLFTTLAGSVIRRHAYGC